MSLLSQTKEICQKLGLKPSRQFGQNFLIEKNTLAKIIRLAEIRPSDLILEIGSGLGFFTRGLAKEAKLVITVESDKKLVFYLVEKLKDLSNVKLVSGDILSAKTQAEIFKIIKRRNYKIVANIPYQITSRLIKLFLTTKYKPDELILLVQKEVAKRLMAQPPQMNLLALSVNFYAQVKILANISRHNFWPRPKVDSALIKLKIKNPQSNPFWMLRGRQKSKILVNEKELFCLMKIGFTSKRKKLISNLERGLKIDKMKLGQIFSRLGWSENTRAENLSLEEWVRLVEMIKISNSQLPIFPSSVEEGLGEVL